MLPVGKTADVRPEHADPAGRVPVPADRGDGELRQRSRPYNVGPTNVQTNAIAGTQNIDSTELGVFSLDPVADVRERDARGRADARERRLAVRVRQHVDRARSEPGLRQPAADHRPAGGRRELSGDHVRDGIERRDVQRESDGDGGPVAHRPVRGHHRAGAGDAGLDAVRRGRPTRTRCRRAASCSSTSSTRRRRRSERIRSRGRSSARTAARSSQATGSQIPNLVVANTTAQTSFTFAGGYTAAPSHPPVAPIQSVPLGSQPIVGSWSDYTKGNGFVYELHNNGSTTITDVSIAIPWANTSGQLFDTRFPWSARRSVDLRLRRRRGAGAKCSANGINSLVQAVNGSPGTSGLLKLSGCNVAVGQNLDVFFYARSPYDINSTFRFDSSRRDRQRDAAGSAGPPATSTRCRSTAFRTRCASSPTRG